MPVLKLLSFVLFVSDVGASKDFYSRVLNQEIAMEIGNINIGFKNGLALWDKKYATNVIFGKESADNGVKQDLEVYFETDDIDAYYADLKAKGVEFVHGIKTQPWQQRVFRVYDPDRFIVEIGETMPNVIKRLKSEGLSDDEIAAKTSMPLEAVKAMQ
ncbi:MAG TPA: VOC family protein [Treponemataceae bacterium]|nr:VOC family protein [Treponemataceae bacterium]